MLTRARASAQKSQPVLRKRTPPPRPFEQLTSILNSDNDKFYKVQMAGGLIQSMAEASTGFAERAFMALYNLQTNDEKLLGRSSGHNGIGFNREDGPIASKLAEKIAEDFELNEDEVNKVLNLLQTYRVQLVSKIPICDLQLVFEPDMEPSPKKMCTSPPLVGPESDSDEDED